MFAMHVQLIVNAIACITLPYHHLVGLATGSNCLTVCCVLLLCTGVVLTARKLDWQSCLWPCSYREYVYDIILGKQLCSW
jgi:hypothetical protein